MARIMSQLSAQTIWPPEQVTLRGWNESSGAYADVATGITMMVVQQYPGQADISIKMLGGRPHAIFNQPYDYFVFFDALLDASYPAGARWLKRRDRLVRASGVTLEVNGVFPTDDDPITLGQIALCSIVPNPAQVSARR